MRAARCWAICYNSDFDNHDISELDIPMPSLSKPGKWRRRLRWASWTALSLLILIGVGAGLLWYSLERTATEGKKLLAEAIAETDALDPRWRWEQIQEDLA